MVLDFITNKNLFRVSVFVWIVVNMIWTTMAKSEIWIGDAGLYQYYASECFSHGTMYPDWSSYYSEYVFNPGWVNFLVIWLYIFKSFTYVPYFLMLCNILNLFLLLSLAKELIGGKLGYYLTGYTYLLLPAFVTTSITLKSEILFMTLALVSMVFALKKGNVFAFFVGILTALSYWVRPLGIGWLLTYMILYLCIKKAWTSGIICIVVFCLTCFFIGLSTHRNFPNYIWTASTGGVNLIMGADDNATGRYYREARTKILPDLFDYDNTRPVQIYFGGPNYWGFTEKYSYAEVDSIYTAQAMNWISNNPIKWFRMLPSKFLFLFSDTAKPDLVVRNKFVVKCDNWFSIWQTLLVRFIVLLALLGLFTPFWKSWKSLFILIPIVVSTALTLAAVVEPRYNFIFFPLIILFAVKSCKYVYMKLQTMNHN